MSNLTLRAWLWLRDLFKALPSALAVACMVVLPAWQGAWANPAGGQVVSGQASFDAAGNQLTVTNSPGAVINWQQFSIGQQELTRFVQENSQSAVLNRVIGPHLSALEGALRSNGRVFLINPNGVVVGRDAVIDTAGFVASTLAMSDEDFRAGRLAFGDGSTAGDINSAGIILAHHGDVVLVAPNVTNSGLIQADGNVLLAAGRKVLVADVSLEGVTFEIQAPADSAINLGEILAGGTAAAFAGTLSQRGIVQAGDVKVGADGEIILLASADVDLGPGSLTRAGGDVRIDGQGATTWVHGDVAGTTVDVLGAQVGIGYGARIDATDVHVGGNRHGAGPLPNSRAVFTDPKSRIDATGEIIVWGDEVANVHGELNAPGGFVETSSAGVLNVTTSPDVSGGGEWLLDPPELSIGGSTASVGQSGATFTANAAESTLAVSAVTGALTGGATVRLVTSGIGTGDILLNQLLDLSATSGANTLVFAAAGDALIMNPITRSGSGSQLLNLRFETGGRAVVGANLALGGGMLTAVLQTGSSGELQFSGASIVDAGGINADMITTAGAAALLRAPISARVLSQSSGSLTVDQQVTLNDLLISGGTLDGAGNISVSNLLQLSGGIHGGTGTTTVAAGAQMRNADTAPRQLLRNLLLQGTAESTASAGLMLGPDATLTIAGGATWNQRSEGDIGRADNLGVGHIVNSGTFVKADNSGTSFIDAVFDSSGTIDVQDGTLTLNQGGVISGGVMVAAEARARLAGGADVPLQLTPTSAVSGMGALFLNSFNGGGVFVNGSMTLPELHAEGGVIQNSANLSTLTTLVARDGNLVLTNTTPLTLTNLVIEDGNLTLGGPASVATFFQDGGSLTSFAPVTISAAGTWNGGSQTGLTSTVVAAGATLTINDGSPLLVGGRTLDNQGTTTIDGANGARLDMGNATIANTGIFNMINGGSIQAAGDFDGEGGNSGTNQFMHNGVFNASGMGGFMDAFFDGNNPISIGPGDFAFAGGGSFDGDITLGSTLQFGRPDGFFFFGTYTIPATTAINGGSSGVLAVTSGNVTIDSTTFGIQEVSVGGATLTLNTPGTVTLTSLTLNQSGTFNRNGGGLQTGSLVQGAFSTFNSNEPLDISGNWDWSGGSQQGAGITTVAGSTLASGFNSRNVRNGRDVVFNGDVTVMDNGSFNIGDGSLVINASYSQQGNLSFTRQFFGAPGSVEVNGTFTLEPTVTGNTQTQVLFNTADGSTVNINGGSLFIGGGGTQNGDFVIGMGRELVLQSFVDFNSTSSVTGPGTLAFTGGGTSFEGALGVAALRVQGGNNFVTSDASSLTTLTQNGGNVTFSDLTPVTLGTFTSTGGAATFAQELTVANLTQQFGSSIGGTGDLSITGSWTWQGGSQSGSGTTTVESGATMGATGFSNFTVSGGRTLQIDGDTAWNTSRTLFIDETSSVVNAGTWLQSSTLLVSNFGMPGNFVNSGTFNANFNGNSTVDAFWTNGAAGTFNLNGGRFDLRAGADLGGMVNVAAPARLLFSGSSPFTLNPAGSLAGAGTLESSAATTSLDGTFTLAALNVFGGTTDLNVPSMLSSVFVSSGLLNLTDTAPVSIGTLDIDFGTVNNSSGADLVVSNLFMRNATLSGSGLLSTTSTADLIDDVVIDLDVSNSGSLTTDGGVGTVNVEFNGGFTNETTGTVSLSGQGPAAVLFAGGLTSLGLFETVSDGAEQATHLVGGALTFNGGTVNLMAPTVFLTQGGDFNLFGATVNVAPVTVYVDGGMTGTVDADDASTIDVAALGNLLFLDAIFADGGVSVTGAGNFDPAFTGFTFLDPDAFTTLIRDTNIDGSQTINSGGRIEVFNSLLTVGGLTSVAPGGALVFNTSSSADLQGGLDNAGNVDYLAGDGSLLNVASGMQSGAFRTDPTTQISFGSGVTLDGGTQLSGYIGDVGNYQWNGVSIPSLLATVNVGPDASVDVLADIAGTGVINLNGFMGVGSAMFDGSVLVRSGGLLDTSVMFTLNTLQQDAGSLVSGGGINSITNVYIWNGGTQATGTTVVQPGAMLNIQSFSTKVLQNALLDNQGTAVVSGTGSIQVNNATIRNAGTWNQNSQTFYQNLSGVSAVFNNTATGTYTHTSTGTSTIDALMNNDGVVDIQAGNLALRGGGQSNGSFMVAGGSQLTLDSFSSAHTLLAPAAVSGMGTLRLSSNSSVFGSMTLPTLIMQGNGFRTVASDLSMLQNLTVTAGSQNLTNAAALDLLTFAHTSGNLTLASAMTVDNFTQSGFGFLSSAFGINVDNAFTWNGGSIDGAADMTVNAMATTTMGGFNTRSLSGGRNLIVNGNTLVNGGGQFNINDGSMLVSNGTWTQQSDAFFNGNGVFRNNGTFDKNGTSTTTMRPMFQSPGTVNVNAGTFTVGDLGGIAGTYTVAANASLQTGESGRDTTFVAGSSITGMGSLNMFNGLTTVQGTFNLAEIGVNNGTLMLTTNATSLRSISVDGQGRVVFGVPNNLTLDFLRVANGSVFDLPGSVAVTDVQLDSRGLVRGAFGMTISGSLDWRGGGFSGAGTTTLAAGATGSIDGFGSLLIADGRTVVFDGDVNSSNFDRLTLSNGSLINNGIWSHDTSHFQVVTTGTGQSSLTNNGTMVFSGMSNGGPLPLPFESRRIAAPFHNAGTVQVTTLELRLTGGGMQTGMYDVADGALLVFDAAGNIGAPVIRVGETGDLRGSAFTLMNDAFNLIGDVNIFNSTSRPHVTFNGFIGDGALGGDDVDWFVFSAQAGQLLDLDIDSDIAGLFNDGSIDSVLSLFDAAGTLLAVDDDSGGDPGSSSGADSFVGTYTLPSTGNYFIAVSGFSNFPNARFSGSQMSLIRPDGDNGGNSVTGATVGDAGFEADLFPGQGNSFSDYLLHVSLNTNVTGNQQLDVNQPIFQFGAAASVTGAGDVRFEGGIADVGTNNFDIGSTHLDGGKVAFTAAPTLGDVLIDGSFVSFNGAATLAGPLVQLDGFASGAGSLVNTGSHTIEGIAGVEITYRNQGSVALNSTAENPDTAVVFDTVTNAVGGTMTLENLDPGASHTVMLTVSEDTLINQGTLNLLPGAFSTPGQHVVQGTLINTGIVSVQAPTAFRTRGGSFQVLDGGVLSVAPGVNVTVDLGGGDLVLAGTGNIDVGSGGSVVGSNGVFVNPGGTVTGPGVFTPPGGVRPPPPVDPPPVTPPPVNPPPVIPPTIREQVQQQLALLDATRTRIEQGQQLSELSDQQSDLEGCDDDTKRDPEARGAGEHGVGCR